MNQVGQGMTRRNLNIQPTLTERPRPASAGHRQTRLGTAAVSNPCSSIGGLHDEYAQEAAAGALPKDESVKLTFVCLASLEADLDRHAAQHSQAYGEAVDAVTLIPHMLELFMAGIGVPTVRGDGRI